LLSVRRLCKDNNCCFICDAFGFCIQDKLTGRVLLQGLCKVVYTLSLYPSHTLAYHSPSPFQRINSAILVIK
jgi:hypothetical protein